MNNIGIYLHIPFCESKCPYCDFYSFNAHEKVKSLYVDALIREMEQFASSHSCKANTLYIGGGTPSVLSGDEIAHLVKKAKELFVLDNAEITIECNPHKNLDEFFEKIAFAGVNRISFGFQSAVDNELKLLGRKATAKDFENAVISAKNAGISNISSDIMLGIPKQNLESLKYSLDFCLSIGVKHISGYMLKLEKGTPFYENQRNLELPNEDTVCDLYDFMCEYLSSENTLQYEVSNFAQKGFESQHNLKYWRCEEYLGLGASAHSFIDGKRFFYPRDIDYFINGNDPVFDSIGGTESEFLMLKLRLTEGVCEKEYFDKFSKSIPPTLYEKAKKWTNLGLMTCNNERFALTKKGFLLSNTVISDFI